MAIGFALTLALKNSTVHDAECSKSYQTFEGNENLKVKVANRSDFIYMGI